MEQKKQQIRIECSKEQWNQIEYCLQTYFYVSTEYNKDTFACQATYKDDFSTSMYFLGKFK